MEIFGNFFLCQRGGRASARPRNRQAASASCHRPSKILEILYLVRIRLSNMRVGFSQLAENQATGRCSDGSTSSNELREVSKSKEWQNTQVVHGRPGECIEIWQVNSVSCPSQLRRRRESVVCDAMVRDDGS